MRIGQPFGCNWHLRDSGVDVGTGVAVVAAMAFALKSVKQMLLAQQGMLDSGTLSR